METKRIFFWACFVVILGFIVWGLSVAMNKDISPAKLLKTPAPVSATDHTLGLATAKTVIIEYSDFQCPACEAYYPLVTKYLEEASSSVLFVYRHFPLPQHANAIPSAAAAEAAHLQGKFWEMYSQIFDNHTDWTELSDPTSVFVGYAKKIGLNVTKFTADMKDPAVLAKIQADLNEGRDIGIYQTPTFFVNGKVLSAPPRFPTYVEFKKLLETAASASTN